MPKRFQFSLKTLLFAVIVVSAFLGGMALQKKLDDPRRLVPLIANQAIGETYSVVVRLRDGSVWSRTWKREDDGEWSDEHPFD